MSDVLWDAGNRRHLTADHPERHLTEADIESVLRNPAEPPTYLEHRDVWESIGQIDDGRWVIVAWVAESSGMYPIHARPVSEKGVRRWRRRWQR